MVGLCLLRNGPLNSIGALAGDIFINNALNGAVEIIAFLVCPYLMEMKMIGRRGCLAGTLILAGVSCLGAMLLAEFGKSEIGKWLGWF